ncbi:MAG: Crp/Fnr family transcriptional regulator [Oscillibacter sp.]
MNFFGILQATLLFQGIAAEDLPALLTCVEGRRRHYARRETVLPAGQPTAVLGVVLSGGVHIVQEDFWGNRTIVGLAGLGELFGEAYACLPGEPLAVSVVAAEDTEILLLNGEKLSGGCERACGFHRRLTENLVTVLAQKNGMLTRKMGHMARRGIREKLLSYLSEQALRCGGPEFDIPLDRQQLADYLAVERSALSATLGKLREAGVLTFRKNHFCLLKNAGLSMN